MDLPAILRPGLGSLVRAWRPATRIHQVLAALGTLVAGMSLVAVAWTGDFGGWPIMIVLADLLVGVSTGLSVALAAPRWRRTPGLRSDPARRPWAAILVQLVLALLTFPLTAAHGLDPSWLWVGPGMIVVLGVPGVLIGIALDLIVVLPLLVMLHRIGPEGDRYRSGG